MPRGVIRYFNRERGYGFIESHEADQAGGEGIYVHHSQITGVGFKTLAVGEEVTFELKRAPGRAEATNVQRVS